MSKHIWIYIIFIFFVFNLIVGCITYTENKVMYLELPKLFDDDKLICYSGYEGNLDKVSYSVSYDTINRQPRWVAYDLTTDELVGNARRKGKSFRQDERSGVPQADNYDYRNSGWTRGHLAPAGDFKWSDDAMNDTFFYTNCCPQAEYFNGVSWERLECKVRDWANQYGVVYVVTGPILGDIVNGRIGYNAIPVPDAFFKAVLVNDGDSYQAIGFIMENSSEHQPYQQCCVSINDIESITHLDLFHNLDDSIEEIIETNYDKHFWGI